jgi:pyridoxal phosphate enzyme (YggS family)
MSLIPINLQAVRQQIVHVAQLADRSFTEIQLLAVSKTFDAEAVVAAATAGQVSFGENYVQEAVDKMATIARIAPELRLEWHFIGPIQSNKTRQIAEHFDWVHSVERFKIAQRLSDQRPKGMAPLNVCLQINISDEDSKSGVSAGQTLQLAREVSALPNLRLRGLMAIPRPTDDRQQQRNDFAQLRILKEQLVAQGIELDTLSMGMSADLESAIMEGSTMVRVGTAIFGSRNYAQ